MITDHAAENDACERDGCSTAGRTYHRYGRAVSTGPWTYSTAAEIVPDHPIRLCPEHALEAFGVAFTILPGDAPIPPGTGRNDQTEEAK